MKTDTLQDSLEKYRQKIAGGGRKRAAAYELARPVAATTSRATAKLDELVKKFGGLTLERKKLRQESLAL